MTSSSHIEVPAPGPCAFCAYLAGERPYTILWRRTLTAALVTREQRGLPHVLVIPVRHLETILELNDPEATAIVNDVREVARLIDAAYGRPGIAVWQNNGSPADQAIPHLHFHVAGTVQGGGTEWGQVPELSVSQTDVIADRLREADRGSDDRQHPPGS
jgi:histidine triad (HIT) family protein